ncbi:anti-sigma factor antagonist [Streptomyces sp. V4-01]|uniref:Anti-sigma factor antagonist n=1 Tax=Actinacidiphila polyblastidii TaxID=3110430 RepID=A0ABU7PLF9_9ACTN|nr:anti-sigma factor antagonist [Streptomyces sp. V4-01]
MTRGRTVQQQGEQRPERARRLGDAIPPPTAHARSYRLGTLTVVELHGEIDLATAETVEPHLAAAAQGLPPLLVLLDLGLVEFIDCFGLSLLVRARRRIADRGGRVVMVCDDRATRKLLALTGLDGVFHPYRHVEDALRDEIGGRPDAAPPD